MRVEYSSNNSGGKWWLKDEDWHALEKAGWKVDWCKDRENSFFKPDKDGRWLGTLATHAVLENCNSIEEAVASWTDATNACATDSGCPCCGIPHSFTLYDGDKWIDSGPHADYSCSF